MQIAIRWLGHSCFRVEAEEYAVILDPFKPGSVPGLREIREEADLVLCSHEHEDHNYRDGVVLRAGRENPFRVTRLETFHDDRKGALRGNNLITILEYGGMRVAHMGDLGCMPEPEQLRALHGVDVMLLPVGGFYTVSPSEARAVMEATAPKILIPMHYRSDSFGFDVIGPVEDFLKLCGQWRRESGDTLCLTPETEPGVVLLTYA